MSDLLFYLPSGREIALLNIIQSEADELIAEYPKRTFLIRRYEGNKHVPTQYWIGRLDYVPKIVKAVTREGKAKVPVKPSKKPVMGVAPAGPIGWYSGDIHVPEYSNRGVRQDSNTNSLLTEG